MATRLLQVSILHLMQFTPLFQPIVDKNAQCVIRFKTTVSALHLLNNEHNIWWGSNHDTHSIMKVGVHLMSGRNAKIREERR